MFGLSVSPGEVIDPDNTVSMPKQAQDRMRPDVASTSSDENVCDFVTPGLPGCVLDLKRDHTIRYSAGLRPNVQHRVCSVSQSKGRQVGAYERAFTHSNLRRHPHTR